MKIQLFINSDPGYPRFAESTLKINGEDVPASGIEMVVDASRTSIVEYLTVRIPLNKVEIYSDASEPIDKTP